MFSTEHSQDFCQILSVPAADVFACLPCITTHNRMELVYFVFFCELILGYYTRLEEIFKQFKFL